MKFVAAVVSGLLASAALAQDNYLPTQEGLTWNFELKSTTDAMGVKVDRSSTATCACKGKEKVGDVECWVFEWSTKEDRQDPESHGKAWVTVSADAIVVIKATEEDLWILPADFKSKKSSLKVKCGDKQATVESTVGDEVEIEVKAGKFKCVPVTATVTAGDAKVQTTVWYAKGTGPIKIATSTQTTGAKVTTEMTLKKFAKGKTDEEHDKGMEKGKDKDKDDD